MTRHAPSDADVVALLLIVSATLKRARNARDPAWRRALSDRHLPDNECGQVTDACRALVDRWVAGEIGVGMLAEEVGGA